MKRDSARLPQLGRLFLTDGGLESDMIFNRGIDLPCFSAVMLLSTDRGRRALERYFRDFLDLARDSGTGLILESATWRASPDWAGPLNLDQAALDYLNREAIAMLLSLRREYETGDLPVVVSGCIGPRGDGYEPGRIMSYAEAEEYHAHQAGVLAGAGADMLAAITMTNVNEAVGIARAARRFELPVAISFTVETDGTLPTGDPLGAAISAVDDLTAGYPAYYMVNCAHPTHFASELLGGGDWVRRVRGLRANASRCSHAELEAMTVLDDGNPAELAGEYAALFAELPQLTVLGGCCGTDIRHITQIARACAPLKAVAA
jgi:homocysteine S-methyltransferase